MKGTAKGELLFLILQLPWSSPLCVLWKSKGAGEESGTQIWWGAAEGDGSVQTGEKEA